MQNNSLAEIKLKANEFIEDYERQITQRQYQKQKLKQNIMLEIMSNRHKTQSQSNSQDSLPIENIPYFNKSKLVPNPPVSQQRNLGTDKNFHHQFNRSNSVPNAMRDQNEDDSGQLPGAQITFKMGKNKQVFNSNQNKKEYYQSKKDYENAYHEDHEQDYNQTLRDSYQRSKLPKYQQDLPITKSTKLDKQNQSKLQKSQKYKMKQSTVPLAYQQNNSNGFQEIQQIQQPDPPGPIFLTVQQNQSMEISQDLKRKNLAFDIKMEKSQPIDDIEELRKKKIQQMQKKRQQRMEQFRKQQQAKKNAIEEKDNKRSNSSLRASNKISGNHMTKISDDIDSQKQKSKSKKKNNIDRDSKMNLSSQNIVQQSHYNMKPPQPQRNNNLIPLDRDNNRSQNASKAQYNQTPKTINSQYRIDKSKGKNTIFRQSPKRADKSSSKYSQQPKIQPKQRKNTFIKQSNKKLMISALANVCLPGEINRKEREKLTQVIERQQAQFFVFLFKQYSRKVIKAIYVLDSSQTFLQKIYGQKAPQQVISENVQSFYRFDSGSREFKKLDGCKSFSLVVHAIDLA